MGREIQKIVGVLPVASSADYFSKQQQLLYIVHIPAQFPSIYCLTGGTMFYSKSNLAAYLLKLQNR
jgi:hypothetical protein